MIQQFVDDPIPGAAPSAPRSAGKVGMALFLAALAMLFAAGLFGYILIRGRAAAGLRLHLPPALWASTFLILLSSFTIQRALHHVRQGHQRPFRQFLVLTLILALAFIAIQTPCMVAILRQHHAMRSAGVHLYGLVFFLVLLHALHVAGGVISLTIVTVKSRRHSYTQNEHAGAAYTAMYWHFLDVVWVILFATMLAMG